jgi:hypothetical protein
MAIAKTSTKPVVVTSDYHHALFAAAVTAQRATTTMHNRMLALLTSKYGTVSPTYLQYVADQDALRELSKAKGLKDAQWVRKPYAKAVKELYKALPVSMTQEAIDKRAARAAAETSDDDSEPGVGAPKGVVKDQKASAQEQIEQFIGRVGIFATLDALVNILAADDTTASQAKALSGIEKRLRTSQQVDKQAA